MRVPDPNQKLVRRRQPECAPDLACYKMTPAKTPATKPSPVLPPNMIITMTKDAVLDQRLLSAR